MSQTNGNRSKLGIKDPRVEHCYDRGNSFLVEDVPNPRQSHPNDDGGLNGILANIKSELFGALKNPAWGGAQVLFVPRKRLYNIMTPERIRTIVTGLRPKRKLDLRKFTHAILRGGTLDSGKRMRPSVRLLAALVFCGRPDRYLDLVDEGISDFCLPPAYRNNDISQPLVCQSKHCKEVHAFLGNVMPWERNDFYTWSYRLNAPYFKKPRLNTPTEGRHNHYYLSEDDILPIITSFEQKPTPPRNPTRQNPGPAPSDPQGSFDGGFSTVTKVEFHPDHYDFGHHYGENSKYFALKKLHASDEKTFSDELASLLTFITDENKHLVKLLLSFEIGGPNNQTRYFLLFPWADGTLWDFWRLNDAVERRTSLSKWMIEECHHLSSALNIFHNERKSQLPRFKDIKENQHDLYGRHGDIKAENILWFSKDDQLVLNDFGLARLNSKISRSAQDPKFLARTETYRAPEFDIPESKISRVSDVFSLGCAFLEFTTWFIEGYDAANQKFVDARMEADPNLQGFEVDTFFRTETVQGKQVSIIKPQVTEWIQRLRNNPRCTQFVVDFLDLIEKHMLDPSPKNRYESWKVEKKLKLIRDTCRAHTDYRTEPSPPR
ncbi:hypothetical protein PG984_008468 [Apiospora sp. TS-2023a]